MIIESFFINKIPEFEKAGVLDAENAERLKTYLRERSSRAVSLFWGIFYILGAAMFVAAAALILKYFWDDFSRPAKLCVAVLPFLAAAAFGIIALLKNLKTCWREAAAAIFPSSVALMLSLTADAYHYNGEPHPYFAAVASAAIIAAFAFKSALGCVITASCALFLFERSGSGYGYIIFAICLLIAAGAVLLEVSKEKGFFNYVCSAAFLAFFMTGLCPMLAWEILPYDISHTFPILNLSAICAVLFLLNRGEKMGDFFKTPVFLAALIAFFIVSGSMINEKDLFEGSLLASKEDVSAAQISIALSIPALCLIAYAPMIFSKLKRGGLERAGTLAISAVFPLCAILALCHAGGATSAVLANLLMFLGGAAFVFSGLKNRDFFEMNIGVSIFIMQAVFRMASADNILAKAAFFFAAGIVLVVFNKILIARRAL